MVITLTLVVDVLAVFGNEFTVGFQVSLQPNTWLVTLYLIANHDDAPVGINRQIYGDIGRKEGERESETLFHVNHNIERANIDIHTIEIVVPKPNRRHQDR